MSRFSSSSNCRNSASASRPEFRDPIGRGDELEVFPDRQRVEELGVVGDIGQLALGRDRVVHDVVPADEEPPARRPDDARQRAEGGRLAGAVGPEQPEDRARRHLEAQPVHRDDLAIRLVIVLDEDQGILHGTRQGCGTAAPGRPPGEASGGRLSPISRFSTGRSGRLPHSFHEPS